ncbi:hypothetical protein [Paenibacillus methanolicus]|uniref:hypothetical protein n=1 Tax=Paenibacillus methanolicus TaxID=582686 RepID=UPI001652CE04|nr:hypothetical protein [Paenibacillus methanolicus]
MINAISDVRLKRIMNTVVDSPYECSEEEIKSAVSEYLPSHSCGAAALTYFAIIAHICYYRDGLQEDLLKIALVPTVYFGITDSGKVIEWVQRNVTVVQVFKGATGCETTKAGRKWIVEKLPEYENLIKELIEQISEEDRSVN